MFGRCRSSPRVTKELPVFAMIPVRSCSVNDSKRARKRSGAVVHGSSIGVSGCEGVMFNGHVVEERGSEHWAESTMLTNGPRHDGSVCLEYFTHEFIASKPSLGNAVTTTSSEQLFPFIKLLNAFRQRPLRYTLSTCRIMNMGEGGIGLAIVISPPTMSYGQIGGAKEVRTGTTSKRRRQGDECQHHWK